MYKYFQLPMPALLACPKIKKFSLAVLKPAYIQPKTALKD